MDVASATQAQYTQETNKSKNVTSSNDDAYKKILTTEELLDDEGYAFLNELLSDMPNEDQDMIKLILSFQLSIKSESVIDGKLYIERETGKLDSQSIESKLDLLIAKRKDSTHVGYLSYKIDDIVDQLKGYYANRSEASTHIQNQEDSVVDEFLEDLYSKESIDFKSSLIKDEIENKITQYASLMMEKRGDVSMSELETAQLLNHYKNELLQEYRDTLENSDETALSVEQQAIIKVLMEENTQESSHLEELLVTDS